MITWVGLTNTFIVSVANLVTAIATVIYVVKAKRGVNKTQAEVAEIKEIVQNGTVKDGV